MELHCVVTRIHIVLIQEEITRPVREGDKSAMATRPSWYKVPP
jgi:hypothetical protein